MRGAASLGDGHGQLRSSLGQFVGFALLDGHAFDQLLLPPKELGDEGFGSSHFFSCGSGLGQGLVPVSYSPLAFDRQGEFVVPLEPQRGDLIVQEGHAGGQGGCRRGAAGDAGGLQGLNRSSKGLTLVVFGHQLGLEEVAAGGGGGRGLARLGSLISSGREIFGPGNGLAVRDCQSGGGSLFRLLKTARGGGGGLAAAARALAETLLPAGSAK
jgi:hypothetical protein